MHGTIKYFESRLDVALDVIIQSFVESPNAKISNLLSQATTSHATNTKTKVPFNVKQGQIVYGDTIDYDLLYSRRFFLDAIIPHDNNKKNKNNSASNNMSNKNGYDATLVAKANLFDLANTCLHSTMSDETYSQMKLCIDRCLIRAGVPVSSVICKDSHSRHKLATIRQILSDASENEKDIWLHNEAVHLDFLIDINTTGKVPTMNIFVQLCFVHLCC